ncbi:MAG: hypothetical protein ABI861_04550, partial [Panacibacter sp.]
MKINIILCFVLLLVSFTGRSQSIKQRTLEAKRTTGAIKIDGLLNDAAWNDAAAMTDMVEFRPKTGALENPAT